MKGERDGDRGEKKGKGKRIVDKERGYKGNGKGKKEMGKREGDRRERRILL